MPGRSVAGWRLRNPSCYGRAAWRTPPELCWQSSASIRLWWRGWAPICSATFSCRFSPTTVSGRTSCGNRGCRPRRAWWPPAAAGGVRSRRRLRHKAASFPQSYVELFPPRRRSSPHVRASVRSDNVEGRLPRRAGVRARGRDGRRRHGRRAKPRGDTAIHGERCDPQPRMSRVELALDRLLERGILPLLPNYVRRLYMDGGRLLISHRPGGTYSSRVRMWRAQRWVGATLTAMDPHPN